MQTQPTGPVAQFADQFWAYLPTLAAGLFVLAVGILLGWIAKKAVVRVLIWLRLDRLGGREGWRTAFGKGVVRAALYNLVGSLMMAVIVLVFLDNAFQIWGLEVLTRLMDRTVFYLPNLGLVALIVGIGVLVTNVVSRRTENALDEMEVQHARLVGLVVKAVLLSLVGALALWQLAFAREIILGAFLIAFGSIGVAFALAVGIGAGRAIQTGLEGLFVKKKGEGEE
jgi:hypothetical protein